MRPAATVLDHRGDPAQIYPELQPLARVRMFRLSGDLAKRGITEGLNHIVPAEDMPRDLTVIDAGYSPFENELWILFESPEFELSDPKDPPVWCPTFQNPETKCPACGERVQ